MLIKIFIVYLLAINVEGLIVMAADKQKAKKGQWRIAERTLFLVALLGGSLGIWAGMYLFHHKTRRWYFVAGMPLILVLQVTAAMMIWKSRFPMK